MAITKVFESYEEFLNRKDKRINGVSKEFAEEYNNYEKMNSSNEGCFNCNNCIDCTNCSYCTNCFGCTNCTRCVNIIDQYSCDNCRQ